MLTVHVTRSDSLMIIHIEGTLTFDAFNKVLKEYYPTVNEHVIWDLRQCSLSSISTGDFKLLPPIGHTYFAKRTPGAKTLFVSGSVVNFGLLNMLAAYLQMESSQYSYHVFQTMDDALALLKQAGN